jgi:carbon-monoxide dehydrogenase small subunit
MLQPVKPSTFELIVSINGNEIRRTIETHIRLLDFLRKELQLTGTKEVCSEGECGACSILLDGKLVNSCLIFAVEAHKKTIITIEGISTNSELSGVQQAFIDQHSVQCGFCIPGMILSGEIIIEDSAHPDREKINHELAGNICRCTGYQKIVDAIESAGNNR